MAQCVLFTGKPRVLRKYIGLIAKRDDEDDDADNVADRIDRPLEESFLKVMECKMTTCKSVEKKLSIAFLISKNVS